MKHYEHLLQLNYYFREYIQGRIILIGQHNVDFYRIFYDLSVYLKEAEIIYVFVQCSEKIVTLINIHLQHIRCVIYNFLFFLCLLKSTIFIYLLFMHRNYKMYLHAIVFIIDSIYVLINTKYIIFCIRQQYFQDYKNFML